MRSFAAADMTGLEGNLRSTRTILQSVPLKFSNFSWCMLLLQICNVEQTLRDIPNLMGYTFFINENNGCCQSIPLVCVGMLFGFKGRSTKQKFEAKDAKAPHINTRIMLLPFN
jgi:hypothetical protein